VQAPQPGQTAKCGKLRCAVIGRLLPLADKAVQWCEQVRDDVITDLGRLIRERRTEFPSAKAAPLGELLEELKRARAGYAASLASYQEELQQLSAQEEQLREYLRSSESTSLDEILKLTDRQFEQLVASLLERDGYQVERAHGGRG
jgi:restriction endonuclease Mrr